MIISFAMANPLAELNRRPGPIRAARAPAAPKSHRVNGDQRWAAPFVRPEHTAQLYVAAGGETA